MPIAQIVCSRKPAGKSGTPPTFCERRASRLCALIWATEARIAILAYSLYVRLRDFREKEPASPALGHTQPPLELKTVEEERSKGRPRPPGKKRQKLTPWG